MMQAGVGLSTHKDMSEAAREASQTALSRAGIDRADLALVFATADHGAGYSRLLRTVQTSAQTPNVVGRISALVHRRACPGWRALSAAPRGGEQPMSRDEFIQKIANCQGYGPACCLAQTADRAVRPG